MNLDPVLVEELSHVANAELDRVVADVDLVLSPVWVQCTDWIGLDWVGKVRN